MIFFYFFWGFLPIHSERAPTCLGLVTAGGYRNTVMISAGIFPMLEFRTFAQISQRLGLSFCNTSNSQPSSWVQWVTQAHPVTYLFNFLRSAVCAGGSLSGVLHLLWIVNGSHQVTSGLTLRPSTCVENPRELQDSNPVRLRRNVKDPFSSHTL